DGATLSAFDILEIMFHIVFNAMYKEYRKAPQITKQRIYLETFHHILPKMGKKYILDPDATGIVPLLQMDDKGAKGGAK
ncbi:MAG: hypothetical protein ACMUIM_07520, partial [bacterium]